VIGPFRVMLVVGIVLRYRLVEPGFEVFSYGGIGIFVDGQRGGGMLDEDLAESFPHFADGRQGAFDFPGDQVEAAAPGGKGDGCLFELHNVECAAKLIPWLTGWLRR